MFWEPINARGTNGKRMLAAGLDFIEPVMNKKTWAKHFVNQWQAFEKAACSTGCLERLHIWPDQELTGFVDSKILEYWWYKPTLERWLGYESPVNLDQCRPSIA